MQCAMRGQQDQEQDECGTECGCKKVKNLNVFANQNLYIIVYGLLGCIYGSLYTYANATITTVEKRFKIPSTWIGFISVGNDISSLLATMLLSYYAGKGHRPRWIACGIYSVALYCFMTLLPHLLWGPGEDALALTLEHGASLDVNLTTDILLTQKRKTLCRAGLNDSLAGSECREPGNNNENGLTAAAIFFLANFVSGVGGSLYYTIGVSYMDDNIKKSKTPFVVSISYFMRMLAPALGYSLGSFFLKIYISPSLTPTITNSDPRWLGAWWAGWLFLGIGLIVLGSIIGLFPRELPKTVQRRNEALKKDLEMDGTQKNESKIITEDKASLKDMLKTIKRLVTNKIYMCNTFAAIFYMFGFMPFWVYTPKYIEVQYHTTASRASFFTGSVGLVFSAVGVLLSGYVITRFKPNARILAGWNVFVAIISVAAILTYPLLGCEQSDLQSDQMAEHTTANVQQLCNVECRCDFVKYSPVCSEDGSTTFISACHAGCRDQVVLEDGKKIYTNCSCIRDIDEPLLIESLQLVTNSSDNKMWRGGGRAIPGPCPVDCTTRFYLYVAIMCLLKFSGATGRTSNFLVSVRCVEEKDKSASMGFGMMLFNLFVFIPSPIIFGHIIDSTCVVWGRTCTGTGNCWQYDGEDMRVLLNYTAAAFVALGTMFDVGVWYYVRDLQIFDEDDVPHNQKQQRDEKGDEHEQQELLEMNSSINNNVSPEFPRNG